MEKDKNWLDFSTLVLFMKCPMKYFWRIEKGISSGNASPLVFGAAIHDAVASWSIDKDEEKALHAFKEGMTSMTQEDPKRNLTSGMMILRRYFHTWKDEMYETITAEIGFAIDMTSPVGDFVFIGKIDRYANSMLGKCILETKTTTIFGDRWLMRGKPNLQIDGYMAGIETITGELPDFAVLDIIHVHEKEKLLKNPQRVLTYRKQEDIQEWSENIAHWWEKVYRSREKNFWVRNTEECVPIMGYTCNYYDLCSIYSSSLVFEPRNELIYPEGFTFQEWHPYETILGEKK